MAPDSDEYQIGELGGFIGEYVIVQSHSFAVPFISPSAHFQFFRISCHLPLSLVNFPSLASAYVGGNFFQKKGLNERASEGKSPKIFMAPIVSTGP